jgi:tryptophan-rich sensory protein
MTRRPHSAGLWLGLAGWILLSFLAAAPGAMFVATASEYQELIQPVWAPPSAVFGPVWTVLYALMGVAAWLVWKEGGFSEARTELGFFLVQLVLNAIWTPLFFGAGLRGWAFLDIVLLWAAVAATLVAFWRIRPLAGALLLPYLAWVSFAAVLNYAIWQLNA